ncbi:MAG: hypothetical protein ACLR4Z_15115 [Butyricicoccaceae bacterium]
MGDRDHLYRAVYNLVDNAVKFIDEGGRLRLPRPSGGRRLCVFAISQHRHQAFRRRICRMCSTASQGGSFAFDGQDRRRPRSVHRQRISSICTAEEISVRSDGGETEFEVYASTLAKI